MGERLRVRTDVPIGEALFRANPERLARIKRQIDNGAYVVDPYRIATAMLEDPAAALDVMLNRPEIG